MSACFQIAKEFHFSASHQLRHLATTRPDHQCARLHGHNYVVVFVLESSWLNADGFVQDYGELAAIKTVLDTEYDHRHLNLVLNSPDGEQTTAERLAEHFYWRFHPSYPALAAVRVSETPKTWAEYRPARLP